jgi:uncharacterized Tic20 family protein
MAEADKNQQEQRQSHGETGAGQNTSYQPLVNTHTTGEGSKEINKNALMWAMFCHLTGLAGLPLPVIGNIVAPLVIWQIKKDDFPFVDEQGKEAVNFQISMSLYGLIGSIACLITCIGVILIPFVVAAIYIIDFIFLLIAAVKANNGHHYHYPLTVRFVK